MASEAATVLLTLVGIAVIVVGVMLLMQMQMQRPKVVVHEKEVIVRRPHPWAYYSQLPLRPVVF